MIDTGKHRRNSGWEALLDMAAGGENRKQKVIEMVFWGLFSLVAAAVICRKVLLYLWPPLSSVSILIGAATVFLPVFMCCLVFIREPRLAGSGFGGIVRKSIKDHPVISLAISIAFPVILFNLVNVFGPHYLLNDDPLRYRRALEQLIYWPTWHAQYALSTFTESFAAWMAAHFSPYVVRLLYLFVYLTGISFCTYWISRTVFGLSRGAAYLAAVLPALFPFQYQILAGINVSYTLLGQLMVLLALMAGFSYLARVDHSWSLAVASGALFLLGSMLMEQSLFLSVPVVLLYLVTSNRNWRKAALILPVVLFSGGILLRMLLFPRNPATPVALTGEAILQRTWYFLGYLSPIIHEWSPFIVIFLIFAGISGVVLRSDTRARIRELAHFIWIPEQYRALALPVFVFAWTACTAIPFLALSPNFSVRTLHLAGYGPWMLMAPGMLFLVDSGAFLIGKTAGRRIFLFAAVLLVFTAGAGRWHNSLLKYERGNYFWNELSSLVSQYSFPHGSRIVITDANMGSYSSYHIACGYLSRLLNDRLDVSGLVGRENFYYDPFDRESLWAKRMTGLESTDNLHLFRLVGGENSTAGAALVPYRYFLRVVEPGNKGGEAQPGGYWRLYEVVDAGSILRYEGDGLDSYLSLLEKLSGEGIAPDEICWGNPEDSPGCNSPLLRAGAHGQLRFH